MKNKVNRLFTVVVAVTMLATCDARREKLDFLTENIDHAAAQYKRLLGALARKGNVLFPYTGQKEGKVECARVGRDWTVGFFPGSLWYLYELTGELLWKQKAEQYTQLLEPEQYDTAHHDVGFIIGCSYLNGLRLADKKEYMPAVIRAARSLSVRFRPEVGVIQSWPTDGDYRHWQEYTCPVVIGSMMNLEILFEATRLSGDSTYYNIAISHADRTLKNHIRKDGSTYQVVDYDLCTGNVCRRGTGQGYEDESSWSRGQAWAIYGYTMCYRYTRDVCYLHQVERLYDYVFTNPKLPDDLVPYWDFDALNIPNEPRDASAAAIMASALYEFYTLTRNDLYRVTADRLLETLSLPAYRADIGKNHCFLLKHSVGSYPHGWAIDKPLVYADYYFLEALKRRRDVENVGKKRG